MQFRAREQLLNPNARGNYKQHTAPQKTDCVIWYIESGSPTEVQRRYREKYVLHEQAPDARNIKRWFEEFQQRGTVFRKERISPRPIRTDEIVRDVLEYFSANEHSSLRRAANELQISKSTIQVILSDADWHPYKMQTVHELLPGDWVLRTIFAEQHLALLAAQPDHLERIWWSDEANFHVNGAVNKQDFRYWSPTNPIFHAEKPLHSPKVTVWAAISANGVVEFFIPEMQNRPYFDTMLFQQDGAPPHFANLTRNLLNEVFPERWIGRGSPNLNWAPRSPDLTPLDFFLWGYVKSKVYAVPIRDLEHLKERIVDAFVDLTPEMIRRACLQGVERRLRKCIDVNGRTPPQNPPPNPRVARAAPLRHAAPPAKRRRGRPRNEPPISNGPPQAAEQEASEDENSEVEHEANDGPDFPPLAAAHPQEQPQRNSCLIS
uniref:DUF4817 domain-containing protein n=1 Tax=Panagrolaimus sp. ES5 TaxID=591445 RepID=A0AC34FPT4_9BILA